MVVPVEDSHPKARDEPSEFNTQNKIVTPRMALVVVEVVWWGGKTQVHNRCVEPDEPQFGPIPPK